MATPKKPVVGKGAAPGKATEQLTSSSAEHTQLPGRPQGSGNGAAAATPYIKAAVLVSLLGIYSNVSELALSPVFGGIPSSVWHPYVLMAGCFVGWASNLALRRSVPLRAASLLPLVALYVPTVQFFLYDLSERLGCQWGPVVTEGLTLLPLAALTSASVADQLEGLELPSSVPAFIADGAPGMLSWGLLKLVEHVSRYHIVANVGKGFLYTRVGMELLLAASYTTVAPSKLLLLAAPALLHTALLNTHVMTPQATVALNATMQADGWMLLDRRESLTGYVSVVESLERGFRVMRCDHSLLGGEWVIIQGKRTAEPIYGVFVMLEAVRLVDREVPVPDADASALVIGLGIGTTPSALVKHGIDTTVVEIDPVVHEFSKNYFDLQENNPPAIADAARYTADLAAQGTKTFDYIVHDVFTGGAEPLNLFTLEFLQGLSALLKPDGVVAINYAGDFSLPTPNLIVNTIMTVFPTCRSFRESPAAAAAEDGNEAGEDEGDFTNMVIFCRKTPGDITFRAPVKADFLGSRAREMFLAPKHEVPMAEMLGEDRSKLLMKNNTGDVQEWHTISAAGHWQIMRAVLPAQVWNWW